MSSKAKIKQHPLSKMLNAAFSPPKAKRAAKRTSKPASKAKAAPAPKRKPAAKPAPVATQPAAKSSKAKSVKYHISSDRKTQHDITEPSPGTGARTLWDAFAKHKGGLTVGEAREAGEKLGQNANQTVIEFYRWRKFNGVTGRQ